jgi:sn-glycerol 3-phosphate transport system substrate-binding protein
MTAKPPISCRLRFGNSAQRRDITAGDLEAIFAGKETAQAGLDDAVTRGNSLLAQFEQNTR